MNNALFVDVPEGHNRLELELKTVNGVQDINLFVRRTAPFTGLFFFDLLESADFWSIAQLLDDVEKGFNAAYSRSGRK